MLQLLKTILYLLGASAVGIGLSFFFFGANATAQFFAQIPALFGDPSPVTGFDSPSVDSEFRFYSVFWIAYGVALITVAARFTTLGKWVPLLATLFFMGGVGRILSYAQYGAPHSLFQILWVIELALPVIICVLWYVTRPVENA